MADACEQAREAFQRHIDNRQKRMCFKILESGTGALARHKHMPELIAI